MDESEGEPEIVARSDSMATVQLNENELKIVQEYLEGVYNKSAEKIKKERYPDSSIDQLIPQEKKMVVRKLSKQQVSNITSKIDKITNVKMNDHNTPAMLTHVIDHIHPPEP